MEPAEVTAEKSLSHKTFLKTIRRFYLFLVIGECWAL